jgi:tRNA-modifying protein YgfZ
VEASFVLAHLRAIVICGVDAKAFLQAQLSANVEAVSNHRAVMAAWCAANGRVVGLGWLAATEEGFVWYVHENQAVQLCEGMRKFKLRSKCSIDLDARAVVGDASGVLPATLPDSRAISLQASAVLDHEQLKNWQRADIAQGYPSHGGGERFLPQMLGLEKLGGLSLKKGCFPGQEVIARLHYKGELKRELRRMHSGETVPVGRYRLADRTDEIDVIQAVDRQFLAVVSRSLEAEFAITWHGSRLALDGSIV